MTEIEKTIKAAEMFAEASKLWHEVDDKALATEIQALADKAVIEHTETAVEEYVDIIGCVENCILYVVGFDNDNIFEIVSDFYMDSFYPTNTEEVDKLIDELGL